MREARVKALALAAAVFSFVNALRSGAMSDLTSEAIYELVRKEMVKILEEDRTSRIREPWSYKFSVDLPKPDGAYDDLVPIDDPDQAQDMLDSFIAEKRWDRMSKPVMDLLEKNKHDVSPWEPEFSETCYQYVQGLGLVLDVIRHRNSGDIEYNVEPFVRSEPKVVEETPESEQHRYTMSALLEKYISEKITSGAWGESSIVESTRRVRMLSVLMDDVFVDSVDHDFARTYKERLIEHRSRGKQLSVVTVNMNIKAASSLFDWMERHGYVAKNYFKGMLLQSKRRVRDEREVFSSEDIVKIFGPELGVAKKVLPWRFWIPLLGLYTGARVEEVSQLHIEDVKSVDGVWVIDINDNAEDKRVKTRDSKRIVPLHPFLLDELGFHRHVERVQAARSVRVFPELRRFNLKYGLSVSVWFSKYLKEIGIEGAKSFHSFRHTFTTNLIHREVPVQVVDWLTGHASPGETAGRYTKLPTDPAVLLPHVLKLDFGVDLSHLKESRFAVKE